MTIDFVPTQPVAVFVTFKIYVVVVVGLAVGLATVVDERPAAGDHE
jgi:hypothetical protein